MKIIIVSGPPRAGKSIAAYGALGLDNTPHYAIHETSDVIKEATQTTLGLHYDPHMYDTCKDDPHEDFFGWTPRQAYITMVKGFYRQHELSLLGLVGARYVGRGHVRYVVVCGVGSLEEAMAYVDKFGADNVLHVAIERDGTSYEGDSREGFTLDNTLLIDNNGTLAELFTAFAAIARTHFNEPERVAVGVPSEG